MAAASILAAQEIEILFVWARRTSKLMEVWIGGALAFAILMSVGGATMHFEKLAEGGFGCPHLKCDLESDPKALQILTAVRGDVLTDAPELLLVRERFSPCFIALSILEGMRASGRFDDQPLLDALRHHAYAAVALNEDLFEARGWQSRAEMWPELRQTIAGNYHLVPSIGPPYIMLPNE